MNFLEITQGNSPVILSFPHTGTVLPDKVLMVLNDTGHAMTDTDWHIHTLYDDLLPDMSSVRTLIHRYAIDVNRDPSDVLLYPGQNTTTLCPATDFDGRKIYPEGQEPDASEINARRIAYHEPYHASIDAEIARIKAIHGFAILYDCHSIRSNIPYLFQGTLPDFNIGTNGGTTCAPSIQEMVVSICGCAEGYSSVLNGRFKGGWTTRHYGDPTNDVHAIQMELAQSTYLKTEEAPWEFDNKNAERLREHLAEILTKFSNWRPA
ncbi:MAG: N-formylglutamate deformylase [Aestuariivita sp.]|nr:N-formylglutamate deformylase [Aestuariivita sp.]